MSDMYEKELDHNGKEIRMYEDEVSDDDIRKEVPVDDIGDGLQWSNKKGSMNLSRGVRGEIMEIILTAGCLPSNAISLLPSNAINMSVISKTLSILTRRGLLEKEKFETRTAYSLSLLESDDARTIYETSVPNELKVFYSQNGFRKAWQKSKDCGCSEIQEKKWEEELRQAANPKEIAEIRSKMRKAKKESRSVAQRLIRGAEAFAFMHGAGITTMLKSKKYATKDFLPKAEYYSSREFSQRISGLNTSTHQFLDETKLPDGTVVKETGIKSTRENGFIVSEGGLFTIYNFSSWSMELTAVESGTMDSVKSWLGKAKYHLPISGIVLYNKIDIPVHLASPQTKGQENTSLNLFLKSNSYEQTYLLPLSYEGQKLMKYLSTAAGVQALRNKVEYNLQPLSENSPFPGDGKENVTKGDQTRTVYVLNHTTPDLQKLYKFIHHLNTTKDYAPDDYRITCFDFQFPYIEKLIASSKDKYKCRVRIIRFLDFEASFQQTEWYEKYIGEPDFTRTKHYITEEEQYDEGKEVRKVGYKEVTIYKEVHQETVKNGDKEIVKYFAYEYIFHNRQTERYYIQLETRRMRKEK